ncbi:MAG: hypothetical protein ACYCWW_13600 [Deltaproteobacteria bacterium]
MPRRANHFPPKLTKNLRALIQLSGRHLAKYPQIQLLDRKLTLKQLEARLSEHLDAFQEVDDLRVQFQQALARRTKRIPLAMDDVVMVRHLLIAELGVNHPELIAAGFRRHGGPRKLPAIKNLLKAARQRATRRRRGR